jgi:ferredoxin-like protein FixX
MIHELQQVPKTPANPQVDMAQHHQITSSTVLAIRISVGQSAKNQTSTDACCRNVCPHKITESSRQGNMKTKTHKTLHESKRDVNSHATT